MQVREKLLPICLVFLLYGSFPPYAASEPDPVQVKYDACIKLMKADELPKASACFSELVELSPSSVNALYYLGLIEGARGNPVAAARALEKVIALDDTDLKAHDHLIGQLLIAGEVEEAIARANAADRQFPRHLSFKIHLIRAYHRVDDRESIARVRGELFRLRNVEEVTDGLARKGADAYLRDAFTVGEYRVFGIEYFSSERPEGPSFSLRAKWGDGKERVYRLELGEEAEPYLLNAYADGSHSTVTDYVSLPSYCSVKKAVIQDLTVRE